MMWEEHIIAKSDICGGDPCIKGTRIPVHIILSHLAAGDSPERVVKEFSQLSHKEIQACLEFAAYLATEKAISA